MKNNMQKHPSLGSPIFAGKIARALLLLCFCCGVAQAQDTWKSFGGPNSNFTVDSLPDSLPEEPERLWEIPVRGQSYGPISVDQKYVVIPDSGAGMDWYYVVDRETGEELWNYSIENDKEMDFGNSPRVRPMIEFGRLYVLNAWGELHVVDMETQEVVWKKNLPEEFEAEVPVWGYCSGMSFVEEGLIVNPGGAKGGLVCLNPDDGSVVWTAPSDMAEYNQPLVTEINGVRQIVTFDATSMFSVRLSDGEVLWRIPVTASSGYICPAPVLTEKGLLVVDQDNGARLYPLKDGMPVEEEMIGSDLIYAELNTPFILGENAYFFYYGMVCANKDTLEIVWEFYDSDSFAGSAMGYPFVDTENKRAAIYAKDGTLTLIDLSGEEPEILSEVQLTDMGEIVPALVNGVIYCRDNSNGAYAYRLWEAE